MKGSSEIQILKVIEFATGKADILPRSFPILDEVVRLLKVNAEIAHLEVEGHTDNRGSDQLNEKLSNDRAHSVMKYLVDHGIAAGRLSAQGFGTALSNCGQQHGRWPSEKPPRRVPHQEPGRGLEARRQASRARAGELTQRNPIESPVLEGCGTSCRSLRK